MQATMPTGGGLTVGVPKETVEGERRVALIPDTVQRLTGQGLTVLVQRGAGEGALFADDAYADAGARLVDDAAAVYQGADIVCKVQRPVGDDGAAKDLDAAKPGQVLIAFLAALNHPEGVQTLAERGITAFGMEAIPRTTRAQSMDALSSQSNIAGYKAVVTASDHLGKLFPMLMTAAGTIAPSKVLVIGAGVAGLQAIATARRLGAVVEAYDTRPIVKEQVESLGAKFVEVEALESDTQDAGGYAKEASPELLRRQQEVLAERCARSDVIITTALVPGRPAPRLISAETVAAMPAGSVIVDLAAENGGNCELTQKGKTVVEHGVTIIGPTNLPSEVPTHSSQMYARNVQSLLGLLVKDGQLNLDFSDDIIDATCLTHDGEVRHAPVRERLGLPPLAVSEPEPEPEPEPALDTEPRDVAEISSDEEIVVVEEDVEAVPLEPPVASSTAVPPDGDDLAATEPELSSELQADATEVVVAPPDDPLVVDDEVYAAEEPVAVEDEPPPPDDDPRRP
ncbi:MAG: Re/Si-specific NAD(P)(+) transhydrogenase subunit alpha [Thermomicrobiales bacterium]